MIQRIAKRRKATTNSDNQIRNVLYFTEACPRRDNTLAPQYVREKKECTKFRLKQSPPTHCVASRHNLILRDLPPALLIVGKVERELVAVLLDRLHRKSAMRSSQHPVSRVCVCVCVRGGGNIVQNADTIKSLTQQTASATSRLLLYLDLLRKSNSVNAFILLKMPRNCASESK